MVFVFGAVLETETRNNVVKTTATPLVDSDIDKMTVAQLKEELAARGVTEVKGLKKQLQTQLKQILKDNNSNNDNNQGGTEKRKRKNQEDR